MEKNIEIWKLKVKKFLKENKLRLPNWLNLEMKTHNIHAFFEKENEIHQT